MGLFILLLGLLCPQWVDAQRLFTVVLDAGHGGKDSGTVGNGGKEKDITLAVAKLVGAKIQASHPEVRVLYTRRTDVFVGLQERADFANRNKASMMLSIHVNSAPSRSVYGTETYVLGVAKLANNLSVAMRENKAMLLESDYKTTYRGFDPTSTESYIMFDLMQDAYFNKSIDLANHIQRHYHRSGRYSRGVRQDILWVLSQSAMPSVLTEIGFLSNASEAAYMLSTQGQEELASSIAGAFSSYYAAWRGKASPRSTRRDSATTAPEPEAEPSAQVENTTDSITASPAKPSSSSPTRSERSSSSSSATSSSVATKVKEAFKKQPEAKLTEGLHYRVQFLSSPEKIDTKDARFRRLPQPIERQQAGKAYIYLLPTCKTKAEAQAQIKALPKVYQDAYIVPYKGSQRLR
nr:N-acetylmuramoyl-L-alanine amidase [uncultured Porphyromonas sp.]